MTEHAPWVIEIFVPRMNAPIKVKIDEQIILGRSVVGSPDQPDIDLGPYGGEEYGVSRQHVSIFPQGDQLFVVDLESQNGSKIDGERLPPHTPSPLHHGVKLDLGRMPLKVNMVVSPTRGSQIYKQPTLKLEDKPPIKGKGEQILIVEDDPEVAKVLALVMEKNGYVARTAHEVLSAIRAFNQKRPQAILLDLMLPDMNGLEFCRYVRRDVVKNTIPVVVVSADKNELHAAEAMQAGADFFLTKPVSALELQQVVSMLITQHEKGVTTVQTKQLIGTAPLQAIAPESRNNSCVIYIAGHSDAPITLNVNNTVSFGRTHSTGSLKTHIDLTRFDAINMGVSRVHMYLHWKDEHFYVEDLGSTNGTFRNGFPLEPNDPTQITNADEIRLGQLRMYIYFLDNPS